MEDYNRIVQETKNAFTEFAIIALRIPKSVIPSYWELFKKSLDWRVRNQLGLLNPMVSEGGYNNCIFIQIPKTATASINSIIKQLGGHRTAYQWKEKLGESFNNLFKFTIVRNPYDRFLSAYYHVELDSLNPKFNEKKDVNEWLKEGNLKKDKIVYQPQYQFVTIDGDIAVDYVGKYEELEKAWKYISKKIGAKEKLPHQHKSPKKQKLNQMSKDLLYYYYKEDFLKFGYEK